MVMATEMNGTDLIVKLADGDLVAIEAKYHSACLTIPQPESLTYPK